MKKSMLFLVVIVVAATILFFSFFWPLNNKENLQGTIGGVEKANKFRGEQPMTKDVLLEDEEFATLIQSAEWQNAMKNEEFVAFLKSEDFKKYVTIMGDMQKIVLLNLYFDTVKSDLVKEPELNEEVVKSYFKTMVTLNQDFQEGFSIFSQDFQNVFMANLDNIEDLSSIDFVRSLLASSPKFKAVFSMNMQKWVNSQEFENLAYSQDFQNTIMGLSQDFQNAISLSQDIQKAVFSQDMQKSIFTSSDVQMAVFLSQDMQNMFNSSNVQAVLNIQFKSILSVDYQQNMLEAFQDYLNCPGSPF